MSAPPLTHPEADRNLLFGILALQMDFISRDALVAAMHAWVLDKAKPLGRILVEQGALKETAFSLLEPLVQAHVEQHGGDAQKSLAALSSVSSAVEDLKGVADPDLQASLAQISAAKEPEIDPYATTAPTVGTPTSTGMRFRILRPHARGGLGEVFIACDEELPREVALKQIQTRRADDPESQSRFLLEAEVTGGLEHPGIVPVYGLGKYPDGRPFYAMRFIKGDNLKEAIRRFHDQTPTSRAREQAAFTARNLEFRQLLRRFVDVCNAIAYAHSRKVLHRDLKPGNIMLGQYGETLVVDWGLAKVGAIPNLEAPTATEEPSLRLKAGSNYAETQMGSTIGTPGFMSPEQAAGRLDLLGPASDIYSLGATLYVILTGRAPITGEDVGAILSRTSRGDFLPPVEAKAGVPKALDAICRKAMALKPEARYAAAQELAADIEHWLADEPVAAHREPVVERLGRWTRRHRPLVAAAAALLVTAVVGLSAGILVVEKEQKRTAEQREKFKEASEKAIHNLAKSHMETAALELERKHPAVAMFMLWQAYSEAPADELIVSGARRLLGGCNLGIPFLFSDVGTPAFSPDGQTILTGSYQNGVRLWDASTGKLLHELQHQNIVFAAAFSPDGQIVLTGSSDKTARLWDVKTGKPLREPLQHQGRVTAVAFSPDGQTILTGSEDKTARLWDASTGKLLHEPLQHHNFVHAVAFSPDGQTIMTMVRDGTILRLWDAKTGKPLAKTGTSLEELLQLLQFQNINDVAFSPDGQTILTGHDDKTARLWDVRTGKPLHQPLQHRGKVFAVAFCPDGQTVLTGSEDKTARLWDASTGKLLHELQHQNTVFAAAFSPDGQIVLTGSADKTARLWDVRTGKPMQDPLRHENGVYAVAFSPDGHTVLTRSGYCTRLWAVRTGKPLHGPLEHPVDIVFLRRTEAGEEVRELARHQGHVTAVAFSPDGQTVLTGSWGAARLWDARSGKLLHEPLRHQEQVRAVAFSPDGQTVLTGSDDNTARLWDVKTGKPLCEPLQHQNAIEAVAFSPDGQTVLTRSHYNTARLWDARTGRPLHELQQSIVLAAAFSPDGQTVLTGDLDGARLWDARTGKPLHELQHQGNVYAVAFSPDGQTVLTGGLDGARLWDVRTGILLHEPLQHQGNVYAVAFSPDGQTVLTGSDDNTARLWDVKTGKPLCEPLQHQDWIMAMAFSPDGQTVLTGSKDETARLWSVPPPAANEPERLRLSVEVRTGYFIDSDGTRRLLTQAEWLERRKQLDELGGFCDIRTWDQVSEAEKKALRTPPE